MAGVTWTASNDSSYLRGERSAKSILAAVRAGRQYLRSELFGEGKITMFMSGRPIIVHELSIHTGYKWEVRVVD